MQRILLGLGFTLAALALACAAGRGATRAGGIPLAQAHAPRVADFDVLSYRIELELLPEERAIRAECGVRLAALAERGTLRAVELDLAGLVVEGVRDGAGRELAFRRDGAELRIELAAALAPGEETEVLIRYSGRPERGLW